MTNEEYRKAEGVSRSDLMVMVNKSPYHFKYALDNPEAEEETPALAFGTAAHMAVLEPERFFDEYAIVPKFDRRTKEGKAAYESFLADNEGKRFITEEEADKIAGMVKGIKANHIAEELLNGEHEKSVFWTDSETGLKCKCRPDCINTTYKSKPIIVDYKTTSDMFHFASSCRKYGYQLQAGMYTEGMFNEDPKEYGFAFVAQEKEEPYRAMVYMCEEDWVKTGYEQFRDIMAELKACTDKDEWPCPLMDILSEEDY